MSNSKAMRTDFAEGQDHYILTTNGGFPRFFHVWYVRDRWIVRVSDLWGNGATYFEG